MAYSDFHTTHWSVVLSAKDDGAALRILCETYYQPVFKYLQRTVSADQARLYGGRDAADLTHDFFTRLLEGNMFNNLRREGGAFRSYLLIAVKHFLGRVRERETASKRGGETTTPLLADDPRDNAVWDDAVFDRDWARTMIDRAFDSLDKTAQTQSLVPWMMREMDGPARSRLADDWQTTEVAVKVALHRLRKKFRQSIRNQISQTVERESEIDAELDYLIRALRR